MWVALGKGRGDIIWGKIHILFWIKQIQNLQSPIFQSIFNDFGFLVEFTPKVMSRSFVCFYVGMSWPKGEVITFWKRSLSNSGYKKKDCKFKKMAPWQRSDPVLTKGNKLKLN